MLCANVLITGTSRGIGLEMVKQMAEKRLAQTIIAACRSPDSAQDLKSIAEAHPNTVRILKLDVCDENSLKNCVNSVTEIIGNQGLNLLINNAGVLYRDSIEEVTRDKFAETLLTNTMAPFFVTKAFLPMIKEAAAKSDSQDFTVKKAAIVNISSAVGSVAENSSGKIYAYRASKSGLNQITKSLSIDLKDDRILATNVHPGWVKTDMGGQNALITTEHCVMNMLETLSKMDASHNGGFFRFNGETIPW